MFRRKKDTTKGPAKKKSALRETIDVVVWAVVMAFLARSFLIQAFHIPSGSMKDTLLVGDFLFVNKFLYGPQIPFTKVRLPGIRDPKPGDILVFQFPDQKDDFIKRCVAVEGQTVEVKGNTLYVDDIAQEEPYTKYIHGGRLGGRSTHFGPVTVPEGKLFMMGDNRDNSSDSRVHGFVDWERDVKGKAIFIYWSWNGDKKFPRLDRIGDLIR
ncbi:MAG: signal peptidase I [bacterium]|nr:signal peptidase I [bacterium]